MVSNSGAVEDDAYAMINQKLHMNQDLIWFVPLFYTIHQMLPGAWGKYCKFPVET